MELLSDARNVKSTGSRVGILRTPILTYFEYIYRKTLYVCVSRSLSVFTSRVSNAYDFVVKNLDMARVHLPNTRRHKFVGDVTTIWFCPDYQFAGRTEKLSGVHVAARPNVWSRWLVCRALTALLPNMGH